MFAPILPAHVLQDPLQTTLVGQHLVDDASILIVEVWTPAEVRIPRCLQVPAHDESYAEDDKCSTAVSTTKAVHQNILSMQESTEDHPDCLFQSRWPRDAIHLSSVPDVEPHPNAERVEGRVLVVAIDDVPCEYSRPMQGGQAIANEQPAHTLRPATWSVFLQHLGTFLH